MSSESVDEYWNSEFTSSEKQLFQKCARKLLEKTFIVRDKDEENRKMFYFISKNSDFFTHSYINVIELSYSIWDSIPVTYDPITRLLLGAFPVK